jgi:hypothetical protein
LVLTLSLKLSEPISSSTPRESRRTATFTNSLYSIGSLS